jgi:acylphosphatase
VGFRYFACREARRLGVEGWVRNLPDGDVEVWAEGPRDAVAAFREWLDEGPPGARVDSVRAEARAPTGAQGGFSVDS